VSWKSREIHSLSSITKYRTLLALARLKSRHVKSACEAGSTETALRCLYASHHVPKPAESAESANTWT
jgi:hypothetical protein